MYYDNAFYAIIQDMNQLNQIQEEIVKALIQLSEKSLITEAVVAKKIRENIKLDGKNKAGLAFRDVEEAVIYIEENNGLHYTVHLNSANDLLIKKSEETAGLNADARKRRLASEKAMSVLTSGDVKKVLESANSEKTGKGGKSGKTGTGPKPYKKRTDKKRLNVYKNYDEFE